MATAVRNGTFERDTFQKFFDCWLTEQNQHLQVLISASKDHDNITNDDDTSNSSAESNRQEYDDQRLRSLIDRVIDHYELYYQTKSKWAKKDILLMFSPSWRSSLEDAFLWIGGWRPSMTFHLLYSKSGLQLEAHLAELIRGLCTGDLADLSATQLCQVDELQRRTIRKEKKITEDLARHQETVADSSMVELSHAVTELISSSGGQASGGSELEEERVESTLASKEEGLEKILTEADDLRLSTLKATLELLTPIQAIHFLIAAAELHLRLHDWGKKRDATRVECSGAS